MVLCRRWESFGSAESRPGRVCRLHLRVRRYPDAISTVAWLGAEARAADRG